MSTLAKEKVLLETVLPLMPILKQAPLPPQLTIVDDRLYMSVTGQQLSGYLMVDATTHRIAVVYDLTGDLNHNFWAKDGQIDDLLALLAGVSIGD